MRVDGSSLRAQRSTKLQDCSFGRTEGTPEGRAPGWRESLQRFLYILLDCFATLAMTRRIFLSGCVIFTISFCFLPKVEAGVFQCKKANGEIEFRDRPCATSSEAQSFLPHQYQKTAEKNNKEVKREEKKLQQEIKILAAADRKEERLKLQSDKKREKAELALERRQLRCERIEEKIARIERQLQQGKKLKTYKRLQEELDHALNMKKRYCSKDV